MLPDSQGSAGIGHIIQLRALGVTEVDPGELYTLKWQEN